MGLATSAASHAAHSLPSTNGPVEKLPTGAIARGTDMAAARALKDFEAAASGAAASRAASSAVARHPGRSGADCRGVQVMAWNAAWHTANERSGLGGDAQRKAKLALEEHADRLTPHSVRPLLCTLLPYLLLLLLLLVFLLLFLLRPSPILSPPLPASTCLDPLLGLCSASRARLCPQVAVLEHELGRRERARGRGVCGGCTRGTAEG